MPRASLKATTYTSYQIHKRALNYHISIFYVHFILRLMSLALCYCVAVTVVYIFFTVRGCLHPYGPPTESSSQFAIQIKLVFADADSAPDIVNIINVQHILCDFT